MQAQRFRWILLVAVAVAVAFGFSGPLSAQEAATPTPADATAAAQAQAYTDALEGATPIPGLLPLYRKKDQVLCELGADHLDHPYLLFAMTRTGLGQGFLVSGVSLMEEWLVSFHRHGEKIEFRRLNTRFFSTSDAQLGAVATDSYHDSIVASLPLVAENKAAGTVLVDLSAVFFQDLPDVVGILRSEFNLPYWMDPARSAWSELRNFPLNLELDVQHTFVTSVSYDLGSVADSRVLPLTVHYSLVEPPDGTTYVPRLADERVGYFVTAMKDLSQTNEDPFIRLITRWRLDKADPQADRSPPKQPILVYLDDSIPYEYRPAVRRGLLEWNKAFEKIGIQDAIEVRSRPEDPAWDPDDIRNSTVRWGTDASFKGINSRRFDPRSGEVFNTGILINTESFRAYSKTWRIAPARPGQARSPGAECTLAAGLADQIGLATVALGPVGPPPDFLDAAVKYLAMHEFGHALGLRHNFKGSSVVPFDKLHDVAYTREHGLVGSIMDYPGINLAPRGTEQGEFFPSTIGPYDYWAIEYGYKPIPGIQTAMEELPELVKIAARSTEPELAFATDEDYYSPLNPDPYTNQFDLSSEPLTWAEGQFELVRGQLNETLADRTLKDGERYQVLRRAVTSLLSISYKSLDIATRYVGGYSVLRVRKGQSTDLVPLLPLPASLQRQALRFLAEVGFSDSLQLPPGLLRNLAPETWNHWGMPAPSSTASDYPIQETLWGLRGAALEALLSPWLLERVQNAELGASSDEERMTLDNVMDEARRAAWSHMETSTPAERALQRQHLDLLIRYALTPPSGSADIRNIARLELSELAAVIASASTTDPLVGAHLRECERRIGQALEVKAQVSP